MDDRVLVAYGTKYGSTAEIAEKIGQVLRQAGFQVDVLPADDAGDPAPYRAVVLGSAVYAAQWRKDAVKFLEAHKQALARRPVWLFSSGPTGRGDALEMTKGWRFPKAQQAIADRIRPRDIAVFHGVLDYSNLGRVEKLVLKAMKAPSGDFRDWAAIGAWAEAIAEALVGARHPAEGLRPRI